MPNTALVIGASRGIGFELVRQYRADGWRVFATVRQEASMAALAAEGAIPIMTDVTKPESLAELPRHLNGEGIDLAVYVAGILPNWNGATQPPTMEEFNIAMHTNALGPMQALPILAPFVSKTNGRFVFLTSIMGSITEANGSAAWVYRASKAAMNMAVYSARTDYPNLTLAVIHPGWVQTYMGGPNAPLTVSDSVQSIRHTIQTLQHSTSGSFVTYDGKTIAW